MQGEETKSPSLAKDMSKNLWACFENIIYSDPRIQVSVKWCKARMWALKQDHNLNVLPLLLISIMLGK